jgi:hypothetical protein
MALIALEAAELEAAALTSWGGSLVIIQTPNSLCQQCHPPPKTLSTEFMIIHTSHLLILPYCFTFTLRMNLQNTLESCWRFTLTCKAVICCLGSRSGSNILLKLLVHVLSMCTLLRRIHLCCCSICDID